jgi:putative ABC transport system substrate-binding protein
MRPYSRRQILKVSLTVAGFSLLSGCEGPGQQPAKARRIGFLGTGSREGRAFMVDGLLHGLRDLGYVEGKNIVIEYRFSNDSDDRLPALAAELIALKVELIVSSGVPSNFAAKRATSTIPIVLGGTAANPVEAGLVASLAHPGGNITGMTNMSSHLAGKRLALLKEIVPGLARVAVFWNPPNPAYGPILKELEAAAPDLGLKLQRLEVRLPGDFVGAFEAATKRRAGALIAPSDPLVNNRPKGIADLALKYRLPAMMDIKEFVVAGGLLSLGPDLADSYRRAATHVDKILKGANPADLPIEQPTKFDLFLNVKTAKALGLSIPQSVQLQATQVIQ